MKPVFSATPTPSSATSTTPRGTNSVNVSTISTMNVAKAVPVSWLAMRSASPVRGSVSANSTWARSAEAIQVRTSSSRNSIAGSGSRLPTVSMPFRARSTKPPPPAAVLRSGRVSAIGEPRSPSSPQGARGRRQSSTSNKWLYFRMTLRPA